MAFCLEQETLKVKGAQNFKSTGPMEQHFIPDWFPPHFKFLWFNFLPGATQPIVRVYFTDLYRTLASSRTRLLAHTQRRSTVGRTPLNEWSVRRRHLYLTTHNTHDKHPCPSVIRTHDLSRRAAVDLRLRPRGHWDRLHFIILTLIITLQQIRIQHVWAYQWTLRIF